MNLQDFHVAEAKEGPVHQPREAVPLQLQRAEGGQVLESQALHPANLVSAQIPGGKNQQMQCSQSEGASRCNDQTRNFPRSAELTDAAGWAAGRTWLGCWRSGCG